jgi:hypothetical protein
LHSRFASLRVRPAHRDYWRSQPYPEEWRLVEWPQGESAPTKYWLSTLPADTDLATLVAAAKCAGGSNATIRNSSRNSASIPRKDEAGEVFTTTWRSASQPTVAWSPNGG